MLREIVCTTKSLGGEIIILTILAWIFTSLRWVFIAYALGLGLPVITYILLHPLITSVSFIPVTIGGLGMLEGGIALTLVLLGISKGKAIVFPLLDRVAMIVVEIFGIKEWLKA